MAKIVASEVVAGDWVGMACDHCGGFIGADEPRLELFRQGAKRAVASFLFCGACIEDLTGSKLAVEEEHE